MVDTRRSRVHFHGNQKDYRKKSKLVVHNKETALPPSSAKSTIADPPKVKRTAGRASRFVREPQKSRPKDFVDEPDVEDVPIFSKKHVASAEENANTGYLQSSLSAAIEALDSSTTAKGSDVEVDRADSPWPSLNPEDPVDVVTGEAVEQQHAELRSENASPPAAQESSTSLSSWLRIIVTLFAGRKKPLKSDTNKQHQNPTPTPSASTEEPSQTNPDESQPNTSESPPTPSSQPAPPRLTHKQTIPSVWSTNAKDPARQQSFKHEPPAPKHYLFGNTFVVADVFTPATTQRGFHATNAPPQKHQSNQSRANLFDRKDDTWVKWHTKRPSPETNPFSRVCSEKNMTDHDARVMRARRAAAAGHTNTNTNTNTYTHGASCPSPLRKTKCAPAPAMLDCTAVFSRDKVRA